MHRCTAQPPGWPPEAAVTALAAALYKGPSFPTIVSTAYRPTFAFSASISAAICARSSDVSGEGVGSARNEYRRPKADARTHAPAQHPMHHRRSTLKTPPTGGDTHLFGTACKLCQRRRLRRTRCRPNCSRRCRRGTGTSRRHRPRQSASCSRPAGRTTRTCRRIASSPSELTRSGALRSAIRCGRTAKPNGWAHSASKSGTFRCNRADTAVVRVCDEERVFVHLQCASAHAEHQGLDLPCTRPRTVHMTCVGTTSANVWRSAAARQAHAATCGAHNSSQ